MFDTDDTIKLADFGTSKHLRKMKSREMSVEDDKDIEELNQTSTGFQGTLAYMAPEIVQLRKRNEKYSYDPFAADMWSLGITLHQCLTNNLPFKPNDRTSKAYLNLLRDPKVNPDFASFSPQVKQLLKLLLNRDSK